MGDYQEHIPISGSDIDDAEIRDNFFYGPYDIRHELRVTGSITLGCDDVSTSYLYFFDGSSATARYMRYNDAIPWFEFNGPIATVGAMRATGVFGNLLADKDIYVNFDYGGGDEDAIEYFNATNQYFMWDQGDQEFRFGGNSLVSLNIKGDQVLVGDRTIAPATGYKYMVFVPNSDGGVGGASVGFRYDYTYKVNQFSNDGVVWSNITGPGAGVPISASIGEGWTAYDYSLGVGHIYATGAGNANTPGGNQSYIGLDAKLDTNDPTISFACGQSGTPITGSLRLDYSETEFVFSEDVRLYNVTDDVNKNLYIKDLTLSAANNINNIYFDNGSFIKSTVDKFHIEAPEVHISDDVHMSGSLSVSGSIRVNDVPPTGTRVANIYFNDRNITQKTDDDMFQLTAERLQLGWGAGSGSGIDTKIDFNIDTSQHAALGGVNPYIEYDKTEGLWKGFDVSGSYNLSSVASGSTGTLQTVTDQGNVTTRDVGVNELYVNSRRIFLNYLGPDEDCGIYFYDNSSTQGESLLWDDSEGRFDFSDDLYVTGTIKTDTSGSQFNTLTVAGNLQVGGDFIGTLTFTDVNASGVLTAATSGSSFQDTRIIGDLNIYGGDVTSDQLYSRGNIYVNSDGPNGDSYLYFYDGSAPAGQSLRWVNSTSHFELSAEFAVDGNVTANAFIADVGNLSTVSNVTAGGNIYINSTGGDGDSFIYFYEGGSSTGRYLQWHDTNNRFEFNDSLTVDGTLNAGVIASDGAITGASADIAGLMQCNSFRIDQTPTGGDPTTNSYITINCNGTTYRIPCVAD